MRIVWVVTFVLCFCSLITAQCPDRMALRSRIYELRYSDISSKAQLEELLPFSVRLDTCPQTNDSVRILLLQRLGALYYMEGKFMQAVSYTESAISALQNEKNTYSDPAFLIKVYDFLQVYYDSLKLLNKKMNAIDSCIHYALLTNRVDEQILYNIWQRSAYSLDVGDFQRCVSYSSMGESLTGKYSPAGSKLVYTMNFFTNRMNGLIGLNELNTAEKELIKKISDFKSAGLDDQCCSFYGQLSTIAANRGDYNSALSYLEKSLKCNRQGGYMLQCKQALNNIGYLYVDGMHEPRKALSFLTQALK